MDALHTTQAQSIMDIGCGMAKFLEVTTFPDNFQEYVGVDIIESFVRDNRDLFPPSNERDHETQKKLKQSGSRD